jgi:hypothetical protein
MQMQDEKAMWTDLLAHLTELHARLEYLRLMIKLGVGYGASK